MNLEFLLQEYRVEEVLCEHPDTTVYLTQHVRLQYPCIIKQYDKKSGAHFRARMEAELLYGCNHPGIPSIYNTAEDEFFFYLIEEYRKGNSLSILCQTENLTLNQILSFGIQLCNLVSYLHSLSPPVLHLDINPNNILIHHMNLSLIDFGASLPMNQRRYAASRYGTIGYAAPEQFNNRIMDMRTDIYAIGCTLEFMLSSLSGEESEDRELQKAVRRIRHITKKCMRVRKHRRFSRVTKVEERLWSLYKTFKMNRKEELFIGIAGTQAHIGATHTALLLCSYLLQQKISCVYIEYNGTGAARHLITEGVFREETGRNEYKGIPIYPDARDGIPGQWLQGVKAVILDYGILSMSNSEDFQQQDIKLIVHGSKSYELDMLYQGIECLSNTWNTYFLCNFQTAEKDRNYVKGIPIERQRSLLYEPELQVEKGKRTNPLFAEIFQGRFNR